MPPSYPPWKWNESRSVLSNSLWPHRLYSSWNSPGQNTGVGSRSFFQGIFPTQGLNPGFQHCRQILNQLSHQESCWATGNLPWGLEKLHFSGSGGGFALAVSTSAQGSLQMQHEQCLWLEEHRADPFRLASYPRWSGKGCQWIRALGGYRARMELEQTSSTSAWGQHLESYHNWELWTHIQQLQEQEAEVDLEMKEQLGCNRLGK